MIRLSTVLAQLALWLPPPASSQEVTPLEATPFFFALAVRDVRPD